jgi:hypothetical protein
MTWKNATIQILTGATIAAVMVAGQYFAGPTNPPIDTITVAVPAAPPSPLVGPEGPVEVGDFAEFSVDAAIKTTHWAVFPSVPLSRYETSEHPHKVLVSTKKPGKYVVVVSGLKLDDAATPESFLWHRELTVVAQGDTPKPVTPDLPAPRPLPPSDPEEPEPTTAPVPVAGFRCLLHYDARYGMPDVFADPAVAAWLDARCVKGEDGKTPEWRRWPRGTPADGDFDHWPAYVAVVPADTVKPYVVFGDGKKGYHGEAPKTGAELLALLKKHSDSALVSILKDKGVL